MEARDAILEDIVIILLATRGMVNIYVFRVLQASLVPEDGMQHMRGNGHGVSQVNIHLL